MKVTIVIDINDSLAVIYPRGAKRAVDNAAAYARGFFESVAPFVKAGSCEEHVADSILCRAMGVEGMRIELDRGGE